MTLDGGEVDLGEAREDARHRHPPLTPAQAEVVRHVQEHGTIRTVEAGVIAHRVRRRCARDGHKWAGFKGTGVACCPYAAVDGLEMLKRLAARGYVERTGRGTWAPPRS